MPMNKRKILVYGDVNLNIIDGSAIWLTSVSEALLLADVEVHVLLKTRVDDNDSLRRLQNNNDFVLHFPSPESMVGEFDALDPRKASQNICDLDSVIKFDAVIARGMAVCKFIVLSEQLRGKSWLYVTDLPFPIEKVTASSLNDLEVISEGAFRLFSQTEESRSYLEALCPPAAGKTLLMPPMIPDEYFMEYDRPAKPVDQPMSLVYAGKFAEDWNTLEMLSLPRALTGCGIPAALTMIGSKFQRSRRDPQWHVNMQNMILESDINWLGGLSRADTMREIRKADFGLGWRSSVLDSSMEISTKALEYAACGVPPILNKTQAHIDIFGEEYPLFVDETLESVEKAIESFTAKDESYGDLVRSAASPYSMSAAVERFTNYLNRNIPRLEFSGMDSPKTNILVAGHDFKFAGELIENLSSLTNVNLLIDKWDTLHKNDEVRSKELLQSADIVICEWAGPNSVWYSNNLLPGQKLYVRLHAFELRGPWLTKIDFQKVSQVFCVSELYASMTGDLTDCPRHKISVIPNLVDCSDLERKKIPGSEFRLGLIGIVPFIKRPDRALDLLTELLKVDSRYTLHIRGRMPWEYQYEWNKGLQRFAYEEFFARISRDPQLSRSVVFEEFGSDMGSWLRKIGVVLSPSTRESFHLAPIEGMASGAVPVVWKRPGAEEIFSSSFVFDALHDMTDLVLSMREQGRHDELALAAKQQASSYDVLRVMSAWHEHMFEVR